MKIPETIRIGGEKMRYQTVKKTCGLCGAEFETRGNGSVCPRCIEKNSTLKNCVEYGEENKGVAKFKINDFYLDLLISEDWEEIENVIIDLGKYRAFSASQKDIDGFIENNLELFGDWLIEKETNKKEEK